MAESPFGVSLLLWSLPKVQLCLPWCQNKPSHLPLVQSKAPLGLVISAASFSKILSGFLGVLYELRGTFAKLCCQNQGLKATLASLLITYLKSESIKEVTSIFLIYQLFWCCTILLGDLVPFQHHSLHFVAPALQAPHCLYSPDSLQDLQEVLLQNIKKNHLHQQKCYSNYSYAILTSLLAPEGFVLPSTCPDKLWRSTLFTLQKPINKTEGCSTNTLGYQIRSA